MAEEARDKAEAEVLALREQIKGGEERVSETEVENMELIDR